MAQSELPDALARDIAECIRQAVAAEREECAKIADDAAIGEEISADRARKARAIAAFIRARGGG